MYRQLWCGPHQGSQASRAVGQPAAAQYWLNHQFKRSVLCQRRQDGQQRRSLLPAAAQQGSSQGAAAAAPEQSDAAEGVAVSTMDALMSVMDEGTGSPDDLDASAQPTAEVEGQGAAAVIEDAAELTEDGAEYLPEDAIRYVLYACSCVPYHQAQSMCGERCVPNEIPRGPHPLTGWPRTTQSSHSMVTNNLSLIDTARHIVPILNGAIRAILLCVLDALLSAAETPGGVVSLQQLQMLLSFRLTPCVLTLSFPHAHPTFPAVPH